MHFSIEAEQDEAEFAKITNKALEDASRSFGAAAVSSLVMKVPVRVSVPDDLIQGALAEPTRLKVVEAKVGVDSYFQALLRVEQAQTEMEERLRAADDLELSVFMAQRPGAGGTAESPEIAASKLRSQKLRFESRFAEVVETMTSLAIGVWLPKRLDQQPA